MTGHDGRKPDDPEQSKRFIDMAKEVGADEDIEVFERAFARVVAGKVTDLGKKIEPYVSCQSPKKN